MRGEFFKALHEQMREDQGTYLVCADMGLGLVEPLEAEFPLRVRNCGIAEANMVGIAAGLCSTGFRPFCYTISNFLIERTFEQIRNDICLHDYPVVLVGTSTGFDNGILGPTHHVIDEMGAIKGLPNMEIYDPASPSGSQAIFNHLKKSKKPAYVRIGKGNWEAQGHKFSELNEMIFDRVNADSLVISHGNLYQNVYEAMKDNEKYSLYFMNKVHPVGLTEMMPLFEKYKNIVVIEDQMIESGLYNSLCQLMIESRVKTCQLHPLCTPKTYAHEVGDRDYYYDKYGFTSAKIAALLKNLK